MRPYPRARWARLGSGDASGSILPSPFAVSPFVRPTKRRGFSLHQPPHGYPRSGFRCSRRGEVSAYARAKGEGSYVLWPPVAATPLSLSVSEALCLPKSFHFWRLAHRAYRSSHPFFLFNDSKIQIQRPNWRARTGGYEAKSEEMGGIGERLGGVA